MRLIALVRQMNIEGLYSPMLTGDWEFKLRQMEHGNLKRADFMREIIAYTNDIVAKARGLAAEAKSQEFDDLPAPCPICGAPSLKQTDATYECREPGCKFQIKRHIAGRVLSDSEALELITKKFVGPLTGFKSKFNKPFDVGLGLDEKFKVKFVFDNDDRDAAPELTAEHLIGEATLTDGRTAQIYQTEKAYHIPSLVTKKEPNGIRIGRSILQRDIPTEQLVKLLAVGKTDLLRGFVSNRTKRKFDAHLTFDPAAGKIGFEFEPRPEKKPASATVADAPKEPAKKATKRPAKKAARKAAKKAAK